MTQTPVTGVSPAGYGASQQGGAPIMDSRNSFFFKKKSGIPMSQTVIKLGKKQKMAIRNFFIKLEKYRIPTNEDEVCIRLNNNDGSITLFEEQAHAYQYYAFQVVKRLVNRGIFHIKVVTNPRTNKKVKVLCLNRQQFDNAKYLIFQPENEIKARF